MRALTLRIAAISLTLILLTGALARAQSGVAVTTLDLLNLRAGPGRQFAIIAAVPIGTTLPALARSAASDWLLVSYNGGQGWLAARYLRIEGDLNALPVSDGSQPAAPPAPPSDGGAPIIAPQVAPTVAAQPQNGDLLAISTYAVTEAVIYYRITYYSDGLRINGFLTEPKLPGKYPVVIYNRGGNRDAGALRGWEFIPFAESGFVVVASQYRGGGGSEGYDNFGGVDVADVLNLLPLIRARQQADAGRIAMFGTSRGGLMTFITLRKLAEAGRGDVRVAATTSAITDLFMWAKERSDLDEGVYPDLIGGTTKSNPAAFRERSATYWAGSLRAPLLVMHGTSDAAVSVKQAEALAAKLRAAGRNARLVLYPGGDHGLTNFDEGYPAAISFFAGYLARGDENYDWNFRKPAIDTAYQIIRGGN